MGCMLGMAKALCECECECEDGQEGLRCNTQAQNKRNFPLPSIVQFHFFKNVGLKIQNN